MLRSPASVDGTSHLAWLDSRAGRVHADPWKCDGDPENGRPLLLWCLLRDQFSHIKPVEKSLDAGAVFIYDAEWNPERMLLAAPDVVLCVNDTPNNVARCLDAARAAKIPSLTLQDGSLEWRCQYENPLLGFGGGPPQHQPVLADKIACIGPSSVRHIASWGNAGKVELTGMPRLDHLAAQNSAPPAKQGRRLLVMTAKKPAFTREQMDVTMRALGDLKTALAAVPDLIVSWRLTKDLDRRLGVRNQLQSTTSDDLADALLQADAVITTPSTAMLEAMQAGRPVACLDYHNTPRFVATAWTISAPHQIGPVIRELLRPPEAKMAFQRCCLEDALRHDGFAATRVAGLIQKMAAMGRRARHSGGALQLPACMVESGNLPAEPVYSSLRNLYPEQEVFRLDDTEALQVRLARAQKENETLHSRLASRHAGFWMELLARKAAERWRSFPRSLLSRA